MEDAYLPKQRTLWFNNLSPLKGDELVTVRAKGNGSTQSKKRRVGDPETIKIVRGEDARSAASATPAPRRRSPAKRAKTANEVMLDAWKYMYKTRDRRLTKP